jgi:hypothetical protein
VKAVVQRGILFIPRSLPRNGLTCHIINQMPNRGIYRKPIPRGYNWATLFLGDINTGTWPSRLGESQMRE